MICLVGQHGDQVAWVRECCVWSRCVRRSMRHAFIALMWFSKNFWDSNHADATRAFRVTDQLLGSWQFIFLVDDHTLHFRWCVFYHCPLLARRHSQPPRGRSFGGSSFYTGVHWYVLWGWDWEGCFSNPYSIDSGCGIIDHSIDYLEVIRVHNTLFGQPSCHVLLSCVYDAYHIWLVQLFIWYCLSLVDGM